jgi:hypothetical protein
MVFLIDPKDLTKGKCTPKVIGCPVDIVYPLYGIKCADYYVEI